MRKLIPLLAALLLLCSCDDSRQRNAFVGNDSVRLQVGDAEQLRYEPLSCQMSFSRDRKTFRVQSDNSSDFFAVQFSHIPSEPGESVTVDLTWTTLTDIVSRKNLSLEVIRSEGGKVWLWSNSARIGLSFVILE